MLNKYTYLFMGFASVVTGVIFNKPEFEILTIMLICFATYSIIVAIEDNKNKWD